MAIAREDVDRLIEEIRADPELRDRVRNAILADDFLALPGIVRDLSSDVRELVENGKRIDERLDRLAEQMSELTSHMRHLDGRVGNLEGWKYEDMYQRHLPSRLGKYYHRVRPVELGALGQLKDALRNNVISEDEWDEVMLLDAAAWASRNGDAQERLVVLELSLVVDSTDVERVLSRAAILARAGFEVDPCVDGQRITPPGRELAEARGVTAFVRRLAPEH